MAIMILPDWTDWRDRRPERPGVYLTAWDDGSVETYYLDEEDLISDRVASGIAYIIAWTENAPPYQR